MAIRNDFTAGEVLAAADLNDTFGSKANYPSGGSNGDLLTKSGTTTAWAAPTPQGLTLITAESFSAVSAVNINGCFTSTHENYRIVIRCVLASGNADLGLRMRAAGADDTSANYATQFLRGDGSTASATRTTTQTSMVVAVANTAVTTASFDLFSPNVSTPTVGMAMSMWQIATPLIEPRGITHNVATAYDGFSIIPASSTVTGTIRIYGYRN